MMTRRILEVSACLSIATMVGCASDPGTIDRTQPNALDKSQFEGIWYYRATVTETDPESGVTEGITSNTDKLRWEITENLLIGYRSYEYVPYGEGLTDEGRDFFGSPVVAYRILSHFDIQREYSPTTGVENNVIVENTTDRPWFERHHVRIDWSENVVGTPARFWTGWSNYPDAFFSGTALSRYYVQGHEETNANRPVITKDYFDITNTYHVEPDEYYCQMMILYNGLPRCGAGNVKARLSFRKIDPADDYESLYYPDNVELKDDAGNAIVVNFDGRKCDGFRDPGDCRVATFPYDQAFGNFRIMRTAFDRERYLTRTGRMYVAGRFDLWEDSFNDADGALLPYNLRKPKPIIYYGNVNFPDDKLWLDDEIDPQTGATRKVSKTMIDAAKQMADAWNVPYMETVAVLQGYTTADGKADVARLASEMRTKYGFDRMFEFRQNTCNVEGVKEYARQNGLTSVLERIAGSVERVARGNIDEVCAAVQYAELQNGATLDPEVARKTGAKMAFRWERVGDLRYSFNNYIDDVEPNGPWGVAQFGQDPETGEFVANTANYFGDTGDNASQAEVDTIQWLNGDVSGDQLLRGDLTRDTVVSRRNARDSGIRDVVRDALMAHEKGIIESDGENLIQETTPGAEESRFARMFQGTEIERELLVNEEMLRGLAGPRLYQPAGVGGTIGATQALVNVAPGEASEEAIAAASPVSWGMSQDTSPYSKVVAEFGRRAYEFADFFDPNTAGLANKFKGAPREEIYEFLRHELFKAVQGHEVGHTLGLRHNFNASMDPLNYSPEFWEKYWNQPSTPENPNRGAEYKYSSVMDYGFNIATEGLHGIGSYDAAAIRFMYGQLVDVWDPKKISVPDPRKYRSWARRCGHDSNSYGLSGLMYWLGPESIPSVLSQSPKDQSACRVCANAADPSTCHDEFDTEASTQCDSALDAMYRDLTTRMEATAARFGDKSACALFYNVADLNNLLAQVKDLPPNTSLIYGARVPVPAQRLITQEIRNLNNPPEYDDPSTDDGDAATDSDDESRDGMDQDGDGRSDDKGLDWSEYLTKVEYGYCSDLYAQFSNPFCQRWDSGWDFKEAVSNASNKYDRDYVFDHFRRDRLAPWGNPRSFMARLESRVLYHMTNVFRYYLYTRRTAFEAPRFKDWAEAAYIGLNFLERLIQTPEPGTYCLDAAKNTYVSERGVSGTCNQPLKVGLGYGEGKFLNTSWTNEYFYKANRVGSFYDKLAAIRQLTTSSGFFVRDLSDLFDRRAFSLGYLRVYEDPMIQRFAALVQGDHEGYRSAVVTDLDASGNPVLDEQGEPVRYVRYMPFFDEKREDGCPSSPSCGASVREWLEPLPKIEPAWSWSLQYQALAYSIANFSSINDYAPEFYRFTKIAVKGTPEDIAYPASMTIVEFTDPETRITYRAPDIQAVPPAGLGNGGFPAYYGDRFHRNRGQSREWGIGAYLLRTANDYYTGTWIPRQSACVARSNDPASSECKAFEAARSVLNEKTGYIDIVRKFNRRAEL